MSNRVYRIHPAIGIARLGNSKDFFIAAETMGGSATELRDGREVPVEKFKDRDGALKKQAVRFRIYEYVVDDAGNESAAREITADDAEIEWTVTLANTKGAAKRAPIPDETPRNQHVSDRASLRITPPPASIAGRNQAGAPLMGSFLGSPVSLGRLRTDGAGRLLVLAGEGISKSPRGRELHSTFNNDDWCDDVADGSVTATLRFPGGPAIRLSRESSSWVITNSPDFAPAIDAVVSLYDVALDVAVKKGWLRVPEQPSFTNDIHPILLAASRHDFVEPDWPRIPTDWRMLADPSTPREVRAAVNATLSRLPLYEVRPTEAQQKILERWVAGNFKSDWSTEVPPITPAGLDRTHLAHTIGAAFAPGIESSRYFTEERLYCAPFRMAAGVEPGELTSRMAVPWQTDFAACGRVWWPAARPNSIFTDPESPQRRNWTNFGWNEMVRQYGRLGFIVPIVNGAGKIVFVERERDAALPHPSDSEVVPLKETPVALQL